MIIDQDFVEGEPESLPEWAPFPAHLLAGAMAGIAEHTLTYPMDLVKTRLQVIIPSSPLLPSTAYKGLMNAVHRIAFVETGGPRQFWRGVQSVVVGAGPAHAVYFASYEASKLALLQGGANAVVAHSVSGALATTLADALMTPFDVVKQRLQLQTSPYAGVVDCFRRVWAREGLRAFYVSYPTTLLLNVPFHGIQFPVYEYVRHLFSLKRTNSRLAKGRIDHNQQGNIDGQPGDGQLRYHAMDHIIAGGTAGAVAAFLTTPLDVLKTTLQTRGEVLVRQHPEGLELRGMRDACQLVYATHGPRGFWRGALPRCLTFMPSTAICWGVYEYFKFSILFGFDE
jgi:solute carrier family 25 iron transporter 28/37